MGYISEHLTPGTIKNILNHVHRYKQYKHHGAYVWVRSDLKGKQSEYCLCWKCDRLHPGLETNCPIAQTLYETCVALNLVAPVWECPRFRLAKK